MSVACIFLTFASVQLYKNWIFASAEFLLMILHHIQPVVYPLTRPQPDCAFAEYIILLRTSHMYGKQS